MKDPDNWRRLSSPDPEPPARPVPHDGGAILYPLFFLRLLPHPLATSFSRAQGTLQVEHTSASPAGQNTVKKIG